MELDTKSLIAECILIVIMIGFLINQRVVLANQQEYITTLEEENVVLSDIVSSNTATIDNGTLEIQELNALLQQSEKQYQDKIRNLEIENRLLQANYESLEKKYNNATKYKDMYKVAKKYLTKDERFLVNYISKGGTIEDAGTWYCTAYCTEKRRHICGTGTGVTASGEPVEAFVSCALNRHNLKAYPFGTHIYIEGVGERVIMDTGGGVRQKQIDCAVDTHYNAVHWSGQGDHRVWVLKEG